MAVKELLPGDILLSLVDPDHESLMRGHPYDEPVTGVVHSHRKALVEITTVGGKLFTHCKAQARIISK